ncbi:MAG: glycosyl transferase family 90 [Opitutales bacterium]
MHNHPLNRFTYYARHVLKALVPGGYYRQQLLKILEENDSEAVRDRVAYYYRVKGPVELDRRARPFRLRPWRGQSTYQLDFAESLRYFDPDLRVRYVFGDNISEPEVPAFVKSRPIVEGPTRAILFNLNRIRHFQFVKDTIPFEAKKNHLVWRGNACQPHRLNFLETYFTHPLCDVGHFYKRPDPGNPFGKTGMSPAEQLRCKFVLALEGNDVATNLKWILSSNSLCVMSPCKYESWFMEGRLVPGVHYVEVKEDYSDLEEKLEYYRRESGEAEDIVRNANAWVRQFMDRKREQKILLTLLWRYFNDSGQLS